MFHSKIFEAARLNSNFRQVLFTGDHSQVVVMSLKVGEDIGKETHHKNDQLLIIASGQAQVEIGDDSRLCSEGEMAAVPAGSPHNVTNKGDHECKIITIYGPADHEPGTVHATKADALKDEGPPEQ